MKTLDHRVMLRVIVAPLVIVGFFLVIAALLYMVFENRVTLSPTDGIAVLLVALIGALSRDFSAVVAFCYGSTMGSERKTELMSAEARNAVRAE